MAIRVLISDRMHVEHLGLNKNFEIDYRPMISHEQLSEEVCKYEVLIVRSRTKVTKDIIDKGKKLRIIARPGTGLDNIDTEYATSRGIMVINSPEAMVEAVSEHTILLMLSLSRNILLAANSTASGLWQKDSLVGIELMGKKLGIVGFGRIGRRVSQLANSFGMKVSYYDIVDNIKDEEVGARKVELDQIMSESDFVSLHVPLTKDTYHLINHDRIRKMKSSSYLINTSRGSIVDEAALIEALNSGAIAGAALDVFEKEPPSIELRNAKNVILTPHIAGQTVEAQQRAASLIGEKIRNYFNTG